MVRSRERVESTAVAQVWCSRRRYSGIPYIFYRQSNSLEPYRQVLEESWKGQGQRKLLVNLA